MQTREARKRMKGARGRTLEEEAGIERKKSTEKREIYTGTSEVELSSLFLLLLPPSQTHAHTQALPAVAVQPVPVRLTHE